MIYNDEDDLNACRHSTVVEGTALRLNYLLSVLEYKQGSAKVVTIGFCPLG